MKTLRCSLFIPAAFSLGLPLVGFAQTTWDFGATPDQNWSSFSNWSTEASPAATAVVFGATGVTASATTVGNIVDSSYTGGSSLSSLTYNANSTNWQVTQISSGQTLTVGGAFLVGGLTVNSQNTKVAFTGSGSLVMNNSAAAVTIANTGGTSTKSTLDMSALSTFTATASSFNVGTGTTGFGTVYLADTSTITATSINSGGSGSSYGSAVSNLIYLGTTTTFNADTVALAGNRTLGTVKFRASGDGAANNTTVSGASLKIRAADGTSRAANMSVGSWTGAAGSSGGTSTVDLTGGSVDALVTTLKVGATTSAFTSTANAILSLGAGTFDATSVIVGETAGSNTGTVTGTLNVSGGTFTAGTLRLANNTNGTMATTGNLNISGAGTAVSVTGDLTLGTRAGTGVVTATVGVSGGTLSVGGNLAEGSGTAANINSTVNLSGGTIDMTKGNVAVDTFTFTGGTLKNVAAFTGNLNAQNAATLGFDNVDGTFTATTLTGSLTLGASANLSLSLANGFTPVSGFTLIDNDGTADSIAGTFATVNGGAFGSGDSFSLTNNTGTYNFTLNYAGGDGNDLVATLSMIPEPSTYAVIFGVLALGASVVIRPRRQTN